MDAKQQAGRGSEPEGDAVRHFEGWPEADPARRSLQGRDLIDGTRT